MHVVKTHNCLFFRFNMYKNRGKRSLGGGKRSTDPREIRSYSLVRMLYMYVIYLSAKNKVNILLLLCKICMCECDDYGDGQHLCNDGRRSLSPCCCILCSSLSSGVFYDVCFNLIKFLLSDQRFLIS